MKKRGKKITTSGVLTAYGVKKTTIQSSATEAMEHPFAGVEETATHHSPVAKPNAASTRPPEVIDAPSVVQFDLHKEPLLQGLLFG